MQIKMCSAYPFRLQLNSNTYVHLCPLSYSWDGDVKQASETGDGPVDAIFKCIKTLYPHDVNLQLYQVHAVTEGTDAQATVSVKIEEKGKTTVGQAADTDTLVASANAYINSLNKMIIKRDKTAPMEQESQKVRGI